MNEVRLIRMDEVKEKTGLSSASIYKQIRIGAFPKGIKITQRSTAWSSQEVEEWISKKAEGAKGLTDEILSEGGWIVLFLGTPYIDGVYSKKEDAEEVKKNFEERFSGIRFAMAFVEKDQDFYISDGMHWNRNEENIIKLNTMCLILDPLLANEHASKLFFAS